MNVAVWSPNSPWAGIELEQDKFDQYTAYYNKVVFAWLRTRERRSLLSVICSLLDRLHLPPVAPVRADDETPVHHKET